MQLASKLLEKIDEIADGHAVSNARLGRQLGVTLTPDAAHSSEFTLKYGGSADTGGMFGPVELRVPGPAADTQGQLVLLDINPAVCITLNEIRQRYGVEGNLSVPTPRQPADSPIYLVYPKSWGKISFGFARDFSCLRKVIIDVETPLS